MKLVRQVLVTAIVPLVGVLLAGIWLLNSSVGNQQEQIQHEDELLQQVVQSRVDALLRHIDAASTILAHSAEAAHAVETRDLNTLHALGRQYEPLQMSRIIYLDLEGRVLSRSDDRYRFGDDLSHFEPIRRLLHGGVQADERITGLFRYEGALYYLIARPVLLYREIPIGLAVSFVQVTSERLQELVLGTSADIEIQIDGERFASMTGERSEAAQQIRRLIPMSFVGHNDGLRVQDARIVLHPDRGMHGLDSLARQFLVLFAALLILLPLLLVMILRRYLRPYAALVDGLQSLSTGSADLAAIRQALRRDFLTGPDEVNRVAGAVADMTQILERQMDELEYLADTDQLTGLKNRRFMTGAIEREMIRVERHGGSLSVLLVDLDEFKRINDALGHAAGDTHLRSVATAFNDNCRRSDVIARWGGEEFLLLCPAIDLQGARELAEKLRDLVDVVRAPELRRIGQGNGVGTLSVGVAQWRQGETVEHLVNRADKALYRAKLQGRNRVEVCDGAVVVEGVAEPVQE